MKASSSPLSSCLPTRRPKARHDALGAGATDFLTKPLDTTEVGLRVLNYLEARRLHLRLAKHTESWTNS